MRIEILLYCCVSLFLNFIEAKSVGAAVDEDNNKNNKQQRHQKQYGDVASNSLSIVVYFPNEANGGFIAQEIFNNSTTISNHRPIPVIYHQPVIASSTTQATHTNSRDDILLSSTIEHVLNSTIDRIFGEIVASSTERVAVVPQTSDSEAEATTLDSENEVVEFTTKITNRFEEESEIHPTCLASLCG